MKIYGLSKVEIYKNLLRADFVERYTKIKQKSLLKGDFVTPPGLKPGTF